jgi:hypothetical protein
MQLFAHSDSNFDLYNKGGFNGGLDWAAFHSQSLNKRTQFRNSKCKAR